MKYLMMVLLFLTCLIVPFGFAWGTDPTTNLVAYWDFNNNDSNTATDVYSGTYNGANNTIILADGIIGQGYKYVSTTSAYTDFGTSANLIFAGEFTVNAWVQNASLNTFILTKPISIFGFSNYMFDIVDGNIRFTNDRTSGDRFVYGPDLNTSDWNMVTGVAKAAGMELYIDGVLYATTTNAAPNAANTASIPSMVGRFYGNGFDHYADVNVDEYSVWGRALSVADINELYYLGFGQTFCEKAGVFGPAGVCPSDILTISVKNERTWADETNVVATIDGNAYTLTHTNFDINLSNINAGPVTIVFSKDGYTSRTYQFNNDGSQLDINMLIEPVSIPVDFKFKVPGRDLNAINTYVRLDKNAPDNNVWTIGQYLTNSDGEATIPLDFNNQNYLTVFSYDSNDYNVWPIGLTVNNPKNELTDLNIDENFNIGMSNNYSYSYDNRNSPKFIWIVPNTIDYYMFYIDTNTTTYDGRSYFLNYRSDDGNTPYLTPYLGEDTLSTDIDFITRSKSKETIKYVDFIIYKTIFGEKVQVMSGRTDNTGSRLFPFILGEDYSIDVIYEGDLLQSDYLYTATATPVYWYIDLFLNSIGVEQFFVETYINYTPSGPQLTGADISLQLDMYADDLTRYSYIIYMYNDINMLTGISIKSNGTAALTGSHGVTTIPLPIMDTNKPFYIDLNVVFNNGDTNVSYKNVFSKTSTSDLDVFRLAFAVRKDMGCSADANFPCALGIIISSILTLLIVFAISRMVGTFFGMGSLVLVVLLLGLFTFIGWFYWPLYIFLLIGGLLAGANGFARGGI